MLYTTFNLAKKAGACPVSYRKYAHHVKGIAKYGADTPIPLTDVLEVNGLPDALWALQCTTEPAIAEKMAQLLAADFAEHVLHFYEEKYPGDDRPRRAIEAARKYARGEIGAAAWAAAGDAARAAARAAAGAAAGAAAWDAAWAAAWAAEQEWQAKKLLEVLNQ